MASYHQSSVEKIFCDCDAQGVVLEGQTGHSATCNRRQRKSIAIKEHRQKLVVKELKKISPKMEAALQIYLKKKKVWIKGRKCAVFPDKPATDVHHKRGRSSIELLLDTNHWLAVSREGHIKIENNPEWAREQGFSELRLAKEMV